MNKTLPIAQFTSFAIPVLLIGLIAFIPSSPIFYNNPNAVSIGMTVDLLLTIPLIHFLLIRRINIPKISILPFFVIGLVVATIVLPPENQKLLHFIKIWIVPIIEVTVVFIVVRNVREAIKDCKLNGDSHEDFFTVLRNVCSKLLPKFASVFLASEIAVIYYGFIRWRPANASENEFTYHKNTGTIGLLIAAIFLVIAETSIIHLLLMRWNLLLAWALTALSIYTAIQLLGFLKSITMRPIALTKEKVFLRYGILSETVVNIEDIESVAITSKSIEFDNLTRSLSLFGKLEGHNIVIRLKEEGTINGLYGVNRTFITLALHVDNKDEFKRQLEENIK